MGKRGRRGEERYKWALKERERESEVEWIWRGRGIRIALIGCFFNSWFCSEWFHNTLHC
jgi:hypothetical protein